MKFSRLIDDSLYRHRGNPLFPGHDKMGFCNLPAFNLEDTEILLTGSSHVYGTNLAFKSSWPILLQHAGANIYSAAMGAWSPLQYALVARDYLRPHHKKMVIGLYLGFDIYASLKHSLETNSSFSNYFLSKMNVDANKISGINWQWKDLRDQFIQQQVAVGLPLNEATDLAHEKGYEDCNSLRYEGDLYYTEPKLRLLTTDLESVFIKHALQLTMLYINYIKSLCVENGTTLTILLFPTKESYLFKSGVFDIDIMNVYNAESVLKDSLKYQLDCDVVDLLPFYIKSNSMFITNSNDGHPSSIGAKIISEFVSPYFT